MKLLILTALTCISTAVLASAQDKPKDKALADDGLPTGALWTVGDKKLMIHASNDVFTVLMSPGGDYILSNDSASAGKVWSSKTGELIYELHINYQSDVGSIRGQICTWLDPKTIAVLFADSAVDPRVEIHNVEKGIKQFEFPFPGIKYERPFPPMMIAGAPGTLAIAIKETIKIYDTSSGAVRAEIRSSPSLMTFANSGQLALVAGQAIQLIDSTTGKVQETHQLPQGIAGNDVLALSSDVSLLAGRKADPAGNGGWVEIVKTATGERVSKTRLPTGPAELIFSRNSECLLALYEIGYSYRCDVIEVDSGSVILPLSCQGKSWFSIAPDAKTIAFSARQGSIKLWSVKTGMPVIGGMEVDMEHAVVPAWNQHLVGALKPDGSQVLLAQKIGKTRLLSLLDMATGKAIRELPLDTLISWGQAQPDGKSILALDGKKWTRWNFDTFEPSASHELNLSVNTTLGYVNLGGDKVFVYNPFTGMSVGFRQQPGSADLFKLVNGKLEKIKHWPITMRRDGKLSHGGKFAVVGTSREGFDKAGRQNRGPTECVDADTGKEIWKTDLPADVISFSLKEDVVAIYDSAGDRMQLIDTATGKLRTEFKPIASGIGQVKYRAIFDMALIDDGKLLVIADTQNFSGGADESYITCWNTATGEMTQRFGPVGRISFLQGAAGSHRFITFSYNLRFYAWEAEAVEAKKPNGVPDGQSSIINDAAEIVRDPQKGAATALTIEDRRARSWTLHGAAVVLAETDPEEAAALARTIEDSWPRSRALYNIALAWSKKDPAKAAALAVKIEDSDTKRNALDRIFPTWIEKDLPGATAWAETNEDSSIRSSKLADAAAVLAKTDLAKAAVLAASIQHAETKRATLVRIATAWAEKNPKEAAQWAATINDLKTKAEIMNLIGAAWAEKNPEQAAAWAASINDPAVKTQFLSRVAIAWAEKNPEKAAALAETIEDSDSRSQALSPVTIAWAKTDPEKAAALAQTIKNEKEKTKALDGIALVWAKTNPEKATALFSKSISGQKYPDKQTAVSIASTWAEKDPEKAAAWAVTIGDWDTRFQVVGGIASTWAEKDPARVETWAGTFQHDGLKSSVLECIVDVFVKKNDLTKAAALADTIPHHGSRCDAVNMIAVAWAKKDPEKAAAWAATIKDTVPAHGNARIAARSGALGKVAIIWAETDLEKAIALTKTMEDSQKRAWALHDIAEVWTKKDLEKAASVAALVEQDGRGQLFRIANAWARKTPEAAATWAATLADQTKRSMLLESILAKWKKADPVQAAKFEDSLKR